MGLACSIVLNLELAPSHRPLLIKNKCRRDGQVCFNDHGTVKVARMIESSLSNYCYGSTFPIVGPIKDNGSTESSILSTAS